MPKNHLSFGVDPCANIVLLIACSVNDIFWVTKRRLRSSVTIRRRACLRTGDFGKPIGERKLRVHLLCARRHPHYSLLATVPRDFLHLIPFTRSRPTHATISVRASITAHHVAVRQARRSQSELPKRQGLISPWQRPCCLLFPPRAFTTTGRRLCPHCKSE